MAKGLSVSEGYWTMVGVVNGKGLTQKGRHRHVMICDGGKGSGRKGLSE